MLIIRVSLDLYGELFSPKKLVSEIKESFRVFNSNEVNDINKRNNKKYKMGFMSIQHPDKIGIEYQLIEYQKWYIDFILKNYNSFINNNVESICLFFDVYYSNQCNFEILDNELLKKISQFNISLPVSVYSQTQHELITLLESEGYSSQDIDEIFKCESWD
ncbi:hypothetical protein XL92_001450 [Salmonella enterica subsp. enterica]|nr:hypothetical protein [Salmonella enterica subsp. enterica]